MSLRPLICLSDLGNILAYYLVKTTLLYKYIVYSCFCSKLISSYLIFTYILYLINSMYLKRYVDSCLKITGQVLVFIHSVVNVYIYWTAKKTSHKLKEHSNFNTVIDIGKQISKRKVSIMLFFSDTFMNHRRDAVAAWYQNNFQLWVFPYW